MDKVRYNFMAILFLSSMLIINLVALTTRRADQVTSLNKEKSLESVDACFWNEQGELLIFESEEDLVEYQTRVTSTKWNFFEKIKGVNDPIVRVDAKSLSKTRSEYIYSNEYCLGEDGWVVGPATMQYSSSDSFHFPMLFKGLSLQLHIDVDTGAGYLFDVQEGFKGNIKYKAKFDITEYQSLYVHKSGAITKGPKYKLAKEIEKTGGYESIIVKV